MNPLPKLSGLETSQLMLQSSRKAHIKNIRTLFSAIVLIKRTGAGTVYLLFATWLRNTAPKSSTQSNSDLSTYWQGCAVCDAQAGVLERQIYRYPTLPQGRIYSRRGYFFTARIQKRMGKECFVCLYRKLNVAAKSKFIIPFFLLFVNHSNNLG